MVGGAYLVPRAVVVVGVSMDRLPLPKLCVCMRTCACITEWRSQYASPTAHSRTDTHAHALTHARARAHTLTRACTRAQTPYLGHEFRASQGYFDGAVGVTGSARELQQRWRRVVGYGVRVGV